MTSTVGSPRVQRCLPSDGLEAFLGRPWKPILNAFTSVHPQSADVFPLDWVVMAPNSIRFLASLGRPLAVVRDFESQPGVWWLATPCGRFDFIVFSDCHRKNSWKGGQICMAHSEVDVDGFTPQHPGLVALCRGFQEVWGQPPAQPSHEPRSLFEAIAWFDTHAPCVASWPKEDYSPSPCRLVPTV